MQREGLQHSYEGKLARWALHRAPAWAFVPNIHPETSTILFPDSALQKHLAS